VLVYGDSARHERTSEALASIRERLALPGRDARVAALIEAGELAQGIADAEFEAHGCDARSQAQDAAMRLVVGIARSICTGSAVPRGDLDAVRGLDLLRIKRPEGFAFYALYPECYFEAARTLQGRRLRVIGLRSIGTTLAAMVGAATDAPLPMTVRPVGHPFRRELTLSTELARELLEDREAGYAVVDEGPGLSGSSFGAVADFLEDRGVSPERIHFFPGHLGELGPAASDRHRARWSSANRHAVDFDQAIAPTLATQMEELVGPAIEPLREISGGAWRPLRFPSERDWPGSHLQQERRKFLLRTADATWLLKFAGLGRDGERAFTRAKTLARAGFVPEVVGLRRGFLVQPWLDDSCPPDAVPTNTVGAYLGFRARHLPAEPDSGATLAQLLEMARHNIAEALGPNSARLLDRWQPSLAKLEQRVCRVETDNRMHAWEWIAHCGRILKADACDHCAAHDLVGGQDIAWDIAGAEFELGMDTQALSRIVARASGREVHPELLAFMRPCYLAFQLGHASLAAEALAAIPDEAARLRSLAARYARLLRAAL